MTRTYLVTDHESDVETVPNKPSRMLEPDYPLELEPYWDYEQPGNARQQQEIKDRILEETVAVWVGILLILAVAAIVGYYLWTRF